MRSLSEQEGRQLQALVDEEAGVGSQGYFGVVCRQMVRLSAQDYRSG